MKIRHVALNNQSEFVEHIQQYETSHTEIIFLWVYFLSFFKSIIIKTMSKRIEITAIVNQNNAGATYGMVFKDICTDLSLYGEALVNHVNRHIPVTDASTSGVFPLGVFSYSESEHIRTVSGMITKYIDIHPDNINMFTSNDVKDFDNSGRVYHIYTLTKDTDKLLNTLVYSGSGTLPVSKPFIITVKTDNEGNSYDNQFILGLRNGEYNKYIVEYNGQTVIHESNSTLTLTFPEPGIYDIQVVGTSIAYYAPSGGDASKIVAIKQWGTYPFSEIIFWNCFNLSSIDDNHAPDLSRVTSLSHMFCYCYALTTLDLSNWDTHLITNLSRMFYYATNLVSVLGLDTWDTSSVTNMHDLFTGCSSLLSINISGIDVSNVTIMSGMFSECTSLVSVNVTGLDLSKVITIKQLFYNCYKLTTIYGLNTWNTGSITDMNRVFTYCKNITNLYDISRWDLSQVEDISYIFYECIALTTIDVSQWNTSSVTNMQGMFSYCRNLYDIQGLESWNTSSVANMKGMFHYCISLTTLNVTGWNVSNVTDMSEMFWNCKILSSLTGIYTWKPSSVTTMYRMFRECVTLSYINVTGWDVSNVNNMHEMFYYCYLLQNITGLDTWNTKSVANTTCMFRHCRALTSLMDLKTGILVH